MAAPPRIAIVGLGGVYPGASNPAELWERVVAGVDGSREVPAGRWLLPADEVYDPRPGAADRVYSRRGYFVEGFRFDPTGLRLPVEVVAGLDVAFHLSLHAGREAWRSAVVKNVDPGRVGVILGNIALPTEKASALAREYLGRTFAEAIGRREPVAEKVEALNSRVAGLHAGLLATALGLGGGGYCLDAACASGLYALYLSAAELRAGRLDAVLAGGVSRPDCLYTQMGFSQLRALSTSGRCAPFDAAADGLVVGEGAGVFVLKRLEDALRDGDDILGLLVAGGLSNDVGGGLLAPNSGGQLRAMRSAYAAAEWSPDDVDLIECHATGTPVGDAVEFNSLRTLWADASAGRRCVLGSVKSTVGHLLTAAGAAAVTKVLAAFRHKTLPPTANFRAAAEAIALHESPFRVLREAEAWERRRPDVPRRAAVSGFGFGGINAHLLLEEWDPASAARAVVVNVPMELRPADVAVVALAAHFGPWDSLAAFRERVLGGGEDREPGPPTRWWGAEASEWFRAAGLWAEQFPGYYLESVSVEAGRFRIPPQELRELLPQQLLPLNVAAEAFDAAGLSDGVRERTGVFLGVALDLNTTNYHFRWSVPAADRAEADEVAPPLTANRTMGGLASIAASRLAREFRCGGPSFTVAGEESSGLRALEAGVRALQRGDVDAAYVGAVDLPGDVRAVLAGQRNPGTVVGEGSAGLILKRLDDAERDGDRVIAVVRGVGAGGDESTALRRACAEADVEPSSIGYVDVAGGGLGIGEELYAGRADGRSVVFGSVDDDVGRAGAASGMAAVVKACLCLDNAVVRGVGSTATPWLRDRRDGPRRAGVSTRGVDGSHLYVVLEEGSGGGGVRAVGPRHELLFVVEGDSTAVLVDGLASLAESADRDVEGDFDSFWRGWQGRPSGRLAVAVVAGDFGALGAAVREARLAIRDQPGRRLPDVAAVDPALRTSVFFTPEPQAGTGRLAFVFPGSGNDFAFMGRSLALRWPEVLRRQDAENQRLASQFLPQRFWNERGFAEASPRERIFAQVTFGSLVVDVLELFGVRPEAAIGYSLGESVALIALRGWRDRDRMLGEIESSSLFESDLVGRRDAARRAWGLRDAEAVRWSAGVVDRGADEVRAALAGLERVYLLLVNSPGECVVGGDSAAVAVVRERLKCRFVPIQDGSTVHCSIAAEVADAYRAFHTQPTTAPEGIRFYSAGLGRAYDVTAENAAAAILAQALGTVDFPAVIEAAYADGVRLFVEVGPGASCTRMVDAVLGERPHAARALCSAGGDEVGGLVRLLALLTAEGLRPNLTALAEPPRFSARARKSDAITVAVGGGPFRRKRAAVPVKGPAGSGHSMHWGVASAAEISPQVTRTVAVQESRAAAQSAYLRLAATVEEGVAATLAFQTTLLEAMVRNGFAATSPPTAAVALNREQCLEFAVGSLARVLGPEFAEVDSFPTRVRLPDEPLMLVDRILEIEGVARSMTHGRVVTEHDIHPDAWYLDGGRIPTSIAVEAGQADLFLSGYLGIDFETRGLAVYRLLDAIVTFHRGLPGPGEVIRYDIHIDRFFRQGETHLFRFRFEGTVGGEPLLTMTEGCAGFFSEEALAAGKGVVQTELDRRARPGVEADDPPGLPLFDRVESYDETQLDALRAGDLAGCFGEAFRGVALPAGLRLAGGRMRLVHRVTRMEPRGGRFGLGQIRAEADIDPKAWFITCHFIDDRVMPGTLMFECCLHTLRIFLLRLGWVADGEHVGAEPAPGVASRLKCRGQVTESTRVVTYEVTIKERGYRPEPYAVVDALMYADGKAVVEITDMSLRLSGLDREKVAGVWRDRTAPERTVLYGPERILAFAVGKPSDAFGEPYRVFDSERVIARLPGPPYQFLDRITRIEAEPWKMVAGGVIEAEYDVPADAWYFGADRQAEMPFAVLLETALQPCGWLAAYIGSALTSPTDLSFRNLGGDAELLGSVGPESGTLRTRVKITRVARSAGMIIQNYEFSLRDGAGREVYRGDTSFGFFSKEALAQQVGLRDATPHQPGADEAKDSESFDFPDEAPFPDARLRMVDRVQSFIPTGGPARLGYIEGVRGVAAEEWFFKAHFHQDPVVPGSLGLESLIQLMKVAAVRRWGASSTGRFEVMRGRHRWLYRGQVTPANKQVNVRAVITKVDATARRLTADGWLAVDGRPIYQMQDFTLAWNPAKQCR